MTTHVKAAAKGMLKKFENTEAAVTRIDRSMLPLIKTEIDSRLKWLREKNLIDDTPPRFNLGSTRLISSELGGDNELMWPETFASKERAVECKTSFGDIDVDVHALVPIKEIAAAFENDWSGKETHCALVGKQETNTAIEIQPGVIVQIDFANSLNQEKELHYNQFSSYLDMAHDIKGLVREILANAITATATISSMDLDIVNELVTKHQNYIRSECNAKEGDQVIFDSTRWSLGHTEFKLVTLFKKITKNGKEIKKLYNIKVDDLIKQDPITFPTEVISILPYNNMDLIAREIGLSNGTIMYHSILMLKSIKGFDLNRKQAIWNIIVKKLKAKRPTATAGGQLSNDEADASIEYMKQFFQGVDYGQ